MKVIGITGPTGAGKTTALMEFEKLGGAVIDCDAVYHQLLHSDTQLQEQLCRRFGALSDERGVFDRKKLGAVVFRDPDALADLNAIVTPYIGRAVAQALDRVRAAGKTAAAVDGITIIESGLAALCDTTVAVVAPMDERVRRICLREGISEEYARARVAAQKTEDWFRVNCVYTLVNDCCEMQQFAQRARDLFMRILSDG